MLKNVENVENCRKMSKSVECRMSNVLKLSMSLYDVNSSQLQLRSGLEMSVGWLVSQSVRVQKLRKTAHWIFLLFCMKLGDQKVRKVTRPDFRKKISFSHNQHNYVKISPKSRFFALCSKLSHWIGPISHIQMYYINIYNFCIDTMSGKNLVLDLYAILCQQFWLFSNFFGQIDFFRF